MNAKGKIMRKLLGQQVASSASNENVDTGGNIDSPKLRPSASQHTIYQAGAPLTSLDRSPDGQRAVIAGAKTFKILKVDGSTITEDLDLRALISSYAASHDLSAATPDQLNIRTVQWSHGTLDTTIVTASGNGRITIYDLNRPGEGLEVARIQEYARQVHKLAINPFKNSWLLSANQDGTVKSFDLRSPVQGRHGPLKSLQSYKCNAEAVRDVKWSSTDGYEFACCTDSGAVLKWDSRKPSAPILKIPAHPSSCSSISWHPDGVHLISGGIDLLCCVWDMSADRNQKPKFTIATPAPVSRVAWRPACWSATAQGRRAAQVTVSYDDSNTNRNQNASVHLWDLARPGLPFKEIEQWDSAPTGILWNSRDILWSVDKAGRFIQTDVAFVPQLIDRRSLSDFAFSPTGDVLMLLEERQPARRSRPSITTPEASPGFPHGNGPLLSVSRSDSEEDVVGSFLGPRRPKGYRRRSSARSVHTMSTTPPSITGMADNKAMSLEDGVKVTGPYKTQQIMAIGHAPSTAKRATYKYFSNRYLQRLSKDPHIPFAAEPMNVRMTSIMESFAKSAEDVRHYRLAQTWRLLGFTINILLTRRAEHHRAYRMTAKELKLEGNDKKEGFLESESRPVTETGQETPRRLPRPRTPLQSPPTRSPRQVVIEEIESTSNVATPLVRPVRDHIIHETREAMHTPLLSDNDDLRLPDPVHAPAPTPAPIPVPGARQSPSDTASSIDGYDFYGMESFSPSLEYVAPPRKQPLRLDYRERRTSRESSRMEPKRHDSGESFQMFSTSAESHQGKLISSSGSDGHSDTREHSRSLRDKVSSWENNFEGDRKHRASIDSEAPTMSDISEGQHSPHSVYDDRGFHKRVPRNPSSPPAFRVQPKLESKVKTVVPLKIRHHDEPMSPTFLEKHSEDPNIIETDFLPWPNDPEFVIHPIDPTVLVQRAIDFEAQTGVLNAAAMVLLLRPLLPKQAVDDIQAAAILRQFHHRLECLNLFTEAALLRNVCVPIYPAVFAPSQERVTVGFFCTDCHKPLENDPLVPGSMWKCPRCRHNIAPCAICLHRDLPPTIEYSELGITSYSSVWWICPGCGHGGHTSCMQAWHAGGAEGEQGDAHSGGCCPLEGCLHPCLPGKWREQRNEERKVARAKEMDSAIRENSRRSSTRSVGLGGVRRDTREVNQSKAVEGVRVALGVTGLSGGGLERKKSVKLVAPGEEK